MSVRYAHTALILAGLLFTPQVAFAASTPTPEQTVTEKAASGLHRAVDWAKGRLAEIDATIPVLAADAEKLEGEARTRADDLLTEMRATRDAYQAELDAALATAGEQTQAQIDQAQAALETNWTKFENGIERFFSAAGSDLEARRDVLRARLEARRIAWDEALQDLQDNAAAVTQEQQAAIAAQIAALKVRIEEGRAELDRLGETGNAAWSVFLQGLNETRAVFDETYEGIRQAIEDNKNEPAKD